MLDSGARRPSGDQADLLANLAANTRFQLQQVLLGNVWSKIAVYFVIGPPLVTGGALLLLATGGEAGFTDDLVSSYASLYKVPSNILSSSNSARIVVLNSLCTWTRFCQVAQNSVTLCATRVYWNNLFWCPPGFPQ